jgi:hypothetical protein
LEATSCVLGIWHAMVAVLYLRVGKRHWPAFFWIAPLVWEF